MDETEPALIAELLRFVTDEQQAAERQLLALWSRPVTEKLRTGWTQSFARLEKADDPGCLWAWLGGGDSRFREGDLLLLHTGCPLEGLLARGLVLEEEEDERWLLRGTRAAAALEAAGGRACYADPDAMDLTPWYRRALHEIATLPIGRDVVLPLLEGRADIAFDDRDVTEGEAVARAEGLNPMQAQAVGLAFGAEQLACIQGPPGTGKTRVLALAVRLMAARGERVMVTSHTHLAIHQALNKIHAHGVPVVKVGRDTQRKGLDAGIPGVPSLSAWQGRPTDGYVVGATPFATCSTRLEGAEFDTIVFDEASQVTVPLALMAMRKGRKYLFVGDQKQLPPVSLSRSVLDKHAHSVFGRLTSQRADHTVMLEETYRLNRSLAQWPSRAYYDGRLVAAGPNRDRGLALPRPAARYAEALAASPCGVFVPSRDPAARTVNEQDAGWVAGLCEAAVAAGLPPADIAIVTPYRAQGRAIRDRLARQLGRAAAQLIVADTVERMQGQEREMIILSLATTDPLFLRAVAPFFFQPERLNVSITRAKTKLIVIGPPPEALPMGDDPTLRGWVAQYVDLLRHLNWVDL